MDEIEEFEQYAMQQIQEQIQQMVEDANKTLKKNVMEEIYNNYSPQQQYRHTYDLINSVNEEIEDVQGYIYFDNGKLHYRSAVTGENVSPYVPYWLDKGHNDSSPINNLYHHYPAKNFLQKTIDELESKYGKGCFEVIGNPLI